MEKNMGNVDRIIRLIVVAGLLALYFTDTITGIWGTIALVASGVFVLTSIVGFCPLYRIVGMNTCPSK